ncbi:MAG TPA: Ig-like domain-containing protein [Anaerolineaceae bacterium]|nr:Ig-like domain-containing protein [Anaerolineaceae bacterium]
MKKNCFYVFVVLLTILVSVTPARAQEVEELELSVSRAFGSSDGTGNIQGTFSMMVTGPSNLVKVQFYIDNSMIAEDIDSPFKIQFVTDDYASGKHTMHALGYTSDGRELRTREMTFNYMTAEESQRRGLNMAVPILALVLIWVLFSKVIPILSRGRKKGDLLPPGGHNYGVIGGTICPRCAHPFALNLFSPNLLVGKLVCCPNCGKWFIGRRASIDDLRIAEEVAWAQAHGAPQVSEMKDEEKIRKGLDDSKYQGM